MAFIIRRFSPLPSTFIWPEDLRKISMTEDEVKDVEKIASHYFSILQKEVPKSVSFYHLRRKNKECCRTIIVSNKKIFVSLIRKTKNHIKYMWETSKGQLYLKKQIFRTFELNLYKTIKFQRANQGIPDNAKKSLPKIGEVYESIPNSNMYLVEKHMLSNLEALLENSHKNFHVNSIIELQNTLMFLHSIRYQPEAFIFSSQNASSAPYHGKVYHGNLSLQNIICEIRKDSLYPRYIFTNFSEGCSGEKISWTLGWGSPETLKFHQQNKADSFPLFFNQTYGTKKDIWAFALIIGSIINESSSTTQIFPSFSFISSKLTIDFWGNVVDDSKIAEVTQKEIDAEIDQLIENSRCKYKSDNLVTLWQVIKKWLRVDPDERPSLKQCHISICPNSGKIIINEQNKSTA